MICSNESHNWSTSISKKPKTTTTKTKPNNITLIEQSRKMQIWLKGNEISCGAYFQWKVSLLTSQFCHGGGIFFSCMIYYMEIKGYLNFCNPFHLHVVDILRPHHFLLFLGHLLLPFWFFNYVNSILSTRHKIKKNNRSGKTHIWPNLWSKEVLLVALIPAVQSWSSWSKIHPGSSPELSFAEQRVCSVSYDSHYTSRQGKLKHLIFKM